MENDQEKPTVSSPTCTALLRCPFCGGEAELDRGELLGEPHEWVQCTNIECGASAAVPSWNKRAS